MKILMVTPGRLPVPAVGGGAVETLTELLLKYNEQYHLADITVLSLYEKQAFEKSKEYKNSNFLFLKRNGFSEKIMQKHMLPYRFFDYCFSKKAGRILRKKKLSFDYIVIQNELVNGWVLKEFLQGSYIYHAHNDTLKSEKKRDVKFLQSCKKVITISDYLSQCFCKKAGITRVTTINNGIDTKLFDRKLFPERGACLREKYKIDQEQTVVVFSGRLVPEKGIEILIDAVKKIPEKYKVVLLVIGASFFKESEENAFVKHLKQISESVKERIIFSGYVEYADMHSYYSMGDIGCVPSLWEEPFGLTAVEQMAMELPVITTDGGAIPEIIDDTCGYIFKRDNCLSENIADAIIDLCVHKEKRKIMGEAGRKKAEESFSQQIFCENWFREVTGRSRDGALL